MSFHRDIEAFAESFAGRTVLGQVLVIKNGASYSILHSADANQIADCKNVTIDSLRELSEYTTGGAYRPLKSAPSLKTGWICQVASVPELGSALNHLYPGGIADWHAVNEGAAATNYRDFTNRQTGMYRITTHPNDDEVTQFTDACCDARFCLKQRLWTLNATDQPMPFDANQIPCLEPCAILLEFSRKTVRISQEDKTNISLAPSELETLINSLEGPVDSNVDQREAEFSSPDNPRLKTLLRHRLRKILQTQKNNPDT